MKVKFILSAVLFSGIVLANPLFGQIKKLKSVRAEITKDEQYRDIEKAKYDIDIVMENPETANNCAAWGWRSIVYTEIAMLEDTSSLRKKLDPNDKAVSIAGESMLKFFTYTEDEQEELDAKTYVNAYLPNVIIFNYNYGIYGLSGKNAFETAKKYMEIVDKLIPYDKEEKAKGNGITKEKAYYTVWSAAYNDSLVDQEIIYLEKLMASPSYMNTVVYIRLSEIYNNKKEYDKALDYLEKGKVKIPQKSSEFLEQQINIELSRGNHTVILDKFTEAIKNDPNNSNYYFSRGVTYHQLKQSDLDVQEKAFKSGTPIPAAKYYFSQCLADYQKAIELDASNLDALNNEAVCLFDSANYLYKQIIRVDPSQTDKYRTMATGMYKRAYDKFDVLKQSGYLKDADYINLLKDMRSCASKSGNSEIAKQLTVQIEAEKKRLESKSN